MYAAEVEPAVATLQFGVVSKEETVEKHGAARPGLHAGKLSVDSGGIPQHDVGLRPGSSCGGGRFWVSNRDSQSLSDRSTKRVCAGSNRGSFVVTASRIVCSGIARSTSGVPGVKCGPASTTPAIYWATSPAKTPRTLPQRQCMWARSKRRGRRCRYPAWREAPTSGCYPAIHLVQWVHFVQRQRCTVGKPLHESGRRDLQNQGLFGARKGVGRHRDVHAKRIVVGKQGRLIFESFLILRRIRRQVIAVHVIVQSIVETNAGHSGMRFRRVERRNFLELEARKVALDGFVKAGGGDAVDRSQIGVEQGCAGRESSRSG